jgi:uncharacterized protein YqeY
VTELTARLRADLTAARKAQNKPLTLLLGTILADISNRALEQPGVLPEKEVIEVIRRGIRKRREAADIYAGAGRAELAARETAEAVALESYLPAQAGDEELRAAVREAIAAGATAVGAVMGRVLPRFQGTADGARLSAIVREELSKRGS